MKHLIETEGNKVTPRGNAARIAALRRAAKHYRVGQVIDYQGEQLLRVDARAKRQFWVYYPQESQPTLFTEFGG